MHGRSVGARRAVGANGGEDTTNRPAAPEFALRSRLFSCLFFVLCTAARGTLLPSSSAHVQSLLDVASKLSEDGERPVICVQTSSSQILISHTDGYTTAVSRAAPFTMQQPDAAAGAGGAEASPHEVEVHVQE